MDRGTFFHSVYRIQEKLGHAFSELEPYALFPLDEYFHTTYRDEAVKSLPLQTGRVQPIRPPVRASLPGPVRDLKAA